MLVGLIYWMGRNVADGEEGKEQMKFVSVFVFDEIQYRVDGKFRWCGKTQKLKIIGFWVLVFWLVG
jgi:hypothetical protein